MVTVTDAEVTGDLREATVFYTVYGDETQIADSAEALTSATGSLRSTVGKQTGIKFVPTLTFRRPTSSRHRPRARGGPRARPARRRRARPGPRGRAVRRRADPYRKPAEDDEDDDGRPRRAAAATADESATTTPSEQERAVSEVGPGSVRARRGPGQSSSAARGPGAGDPTDGGKRGEIGTAPSIAADEPDDGPRTRRRWLGRRGADARRSPTRPGRLTRDVPRPRAAASARTAPSVLAEAADARATVVLSATCSPTPDALGSTLSLAEGLRRRGARVLTTFPDPFTLPASLGWLPGAEGLVPSSSVALVAGRVRQPGRRLARPAR
jgi:ribosome-binding factor A